MKNSGIFLFTVLLIGASLLAAFGQAALVANPGAPAIATVGLPVTAVAPVTAVGPVTPNAPVTAVPPSTAVPPKSASAPATAASPATAAATATLATARPAIVVKPNPVKGNTCSLLSKNQVGNILGEAVVDLRDPTKQGTLCVYQTQNLILELTFMHSFSGSGNSVNFMQQTRADGLGVAPLNVPGLGDEAFYHGNATYRILFVRKGDTVYTFGVRKVTTYQSLSSPDNAQTLEKSVADLLMPLVP